MAQGFTGNSSFAALETAIDEYSKPEGFTSLSNLGDQFNRQQ